MLSVELGSAWERVHDIQIQGAQLLLLHWWEGLASSGVAQVKARAEADVTGGS